MTGRVALAVLALSMGLPAQDLAEGRRGSPVRVLIYEDLQCPDCAQFRTMLDEKLLPKYGDRVSFIHRDFPLAKHAWARKAAIAARFFSARDEKLGLEFRRYMMARIRETKAENFNERLETFAREHGVKAEAAVAALDDPKFAALVEKDFQDGVARGIVRTPTALVNGKPFIETFTLEEISKGIEEALAQTH